MHKYFDYIYFSTISIMSIVENVSLGQQLVTNEIEEKLSIESENNFMINLESSEEDSCEKLEYISYSFSDKVYARLKEAVDGNPWIIWQFGKAPKELQELCSQGGDEDYIVFMPGLFLDHKINHKDCRSALRTGFVTEYKLYQKCTGNLWGTIAVTTHS